MSGEDGPMANGGGTCDGGGDADVDVVVYKTNDHGSNHSSSSTPVTTTTTVTVASPRPPVVVTPPTPGSVSDPPTSTIQVDGDAALGDDGKTVALDEIPSSVKEPCTAESLEQSPKRQRTGLVNQDENDDTIDGNESSLVGGSDKGLLAGAMDIVTNDGNPATADIMDVARSASSGGAREMDPDGDLHDDNIDVNSAETAERAEQEEKHQVQTAIAFTEPSDKAPPPPPHPITESDAKPVRKHIRSKGVDQRVLEIRRKIQQGCKNNDLASAMEAYDEANQQGIRLEAQSFYSLLNLCDGLDRGVHIGTPKAPHATASNNENDDANQNHVIDWRKRQEYAFQIKDHMDRQSLALNETAYSAIVKILCRNKEFDKAQCVLDEAERVQQCKPKLRLYSSLLVAYCQEGRMIDALRCWKRLRQQNGLTMTEREYLHLIRCATLTGDSLVMQQVLTNLADEVPIPSKDAVAAIIEWFEIKHSQHTESLTTRHADEGDVQQLLEEINASSDQIGISEPPPVMGPIVNTKGWTISSACHVDTASGVLTEGCLTGHQLQPLHISDHAFQEMQQMNEAIVLEGKVDGNNSEFQGGRKGRKRTNFCPETRRKEWTILAEILDSKMTGTAGHSAIEVVLDGANIGYYKQNFSNAPHHVDYEQIDWVVRKFQVEKKQRVLLVMHARHFSNNLLPTKYKPICDAWEKEGILFKTPPGMNDDWFWMHAALKYKTLVVTNDEMRDHHFQMLAPRFFLRWKERHQIHFDFGAWQGGTAGAATDRMEDGDKHGNNRQREVLLIYPDVYSRRIQRVANGLVIPLAKRGDENRFLDGCHVASEDEPMQQTYLCIRPKDTSDEPMPKSDVEP